MTTVEILQAAREIISEKEDWTGGSNHIPAFDAHCASTAISDTVSVSQAGFWDAVLALQEAAGLEPMRSLGVIWQWNDNPERTHEEVLAAFDKAIENCYSLKD